MVTKMKKSKVMKTRSGEKWDSPQRKRSSIHAHKVAGSANHNAADPSPPSTTVHEDLERTLLEQLSLIKITVETYLTNLDRGREGLRLTIQSLSSIHGTLTRLFNPEPEDQAGYIT